MTTGPTLRSATLDTPIGTVTVVATDAAVVAVHLPGDPRPAGPGVRHVSDTIPIPVPDTTDGGSDVLGEAVRQLEQYFAGERTEFELPLDPSGTPFQHAVWGVLRTIAFGTTMTYGEQARRLGDARKSRAVGAANGRNPIAIVVPCHRVIGSSGRLTGYAGGLDAKAWLLDHEQRVLLAR